MGEHPVRDIISGRSGQVTAATRDAVRGLYDRLWDVPPPERTPAQPKPPPAPGADPADVRDRGTGWVGDVCAGRSTGQRLFSLVYPLTVSSGRCPSRSPRTVIMAGTWGPVVTSRPVSVSGYLEFGPAEPVCDERCALTGIAATSAVAEIRSPLRFTLMRCERVTGRAAAGILARHSSRCSSSMVMPTSDRIPRSVPLATSRRWCTGTVVPRPSGWRMM